MVTPVEHHDKQRQKLLIFRTFQVHQLSWVGYLAPATFVPTFGVHHFGRAHSVGRTANPAVSAEIKIFSCASSVMRTHQETSCSVLNFPGSPHPFPCSGSIDVHHLSITAFASHASEGVG